MASPSGVDPLLLWAKWSKHKHAPTYHPLLCHMVDVAAVVLELWAEILPEGGRRLLAVGLGLEPEGAAPWVAYLAGLHDLGKASPAFQLKVDAARPGLEAAGLLRVLPGTDAPHGTVTARVLPPLLAGEFGVGPEVARRLATAVGGHHGAFPTSGDTGRLAPDAVGGGRWEAVRRELALSLAGALGVPRDAVPTGLPHPAALALAGLVSVTDWIGSNELYFPHLVTGDPDRGGAPCVPEADPIAYLALGRERARRALSALGWRGWPRAAEPRPFGSLFGDLGEPRPVQAAAVELAARLDAPALVVVEAPMGEGKTETALYLADRWGAVRDSPRSGGERASPGCYIALPTQATSNGMYPRVRDFLEHRYPGRFVNLQLAHGHAALSAELDLLPSRPPFSPDGLYDEPTGADGAPPAVLAAEWFAHRRRALLAPWGVGTVDQALLAVLQVRHGFVRLWGLSGKTVVVDEVHAFDAYMSTLLERLLEWLAALGSPVVLLSATLPRTRRERLLAAYAQGAGWGESRTARAAYPRLSWVGAAGAGALAVATSPERRRTLHLERVDGRVPRQPAVTFGLGARLEDALRGGGCAAVVCNTVRRAQEVYAALKPLFGERADDGELELDLLHARFLYGEREVREARVLRRFGPGGGAHRPRRAVLVATQLVEQSLDLDFDLLVTDHAPADLLLQRAGRLHRHERERPDALSEPALWLCDAEGWEGGVPRFGRGTEAVYDRHVLLRSWLALRDRRAVRLPDEIEELVEAVYDDERDPPPGLAEQLLRAWEETRRELREGRDGEEVKARTVRILPPYYPDEVLEDFNRRLEEDDPTVSASLQALTRLGDPSVRVVFLRPDEEHLLQRGVATDAARELLRRSTVVASKRAVFALLAESPPPGWKRSVLLRHHRLVRLDGAGRGATAGGLRMRLDPELGLIIGGEETGGADGDVRSG